MFSTCIISLLIDVTIICKFVVGHSFYRICSFKKKYHYDCILFLEDHYCSYYYLCYIALVCKHAFHWVNLLLLDESFHMNHSLVADNAVALI